MGCCLAPAVGMRLCRHCWASCVRSKALKGMRRHRRPKEGAQVRPPAGGHMGANGAHGRRWGTWGTGVPNGHLGAAGAKWGESLGCMMGVVLRYPPACSECSTHFPTLQASFPRRRHAFDFPFCCCRVVLYGWRHMPPPPGRRPAPPLSPATSPGWGLMVQARHPRPVWH